MMKKFFEMLGVYRNTIAFAAVILMVAYLLITELINLF
jgi:hypothetical protein